MKYTLLFLFFSNVYFLVQGSLLKFRRKTCTDRKIRRLLIIVLRALMPLFQFEEGLVDIGNPCCIAIELSLSLMLNDEAGDTMQNSR